MEKLSARLSIRRTETRELRRYRQFYLAYPQIREALTPELTTGGKTIAQKLSFTHLFVNDAEKLAEAGI